MSNFVSIIISYLTSAATSSYSKMVKSLFHRYFSFSNKVFDSVAYIMNGLQHLTTPTSLKFFLALCFSSGPNYSKFGPSYPQVGPNFFHLAKEMAPTFLEPERTLKCYFLDMEYFIDAIMCSGRIQLLPSKLKTLFSYTPRFT